MSRSRVVTSLRDRGAARILAHHSEARCPTAVRSGSYREGAEIEIRPTLLDQGRVTFR